MSEESESLNEEERSVFRPFTKESLSAIEARVAEENAKKKELQKKKEEGEVCGVALHAFCFILSGVQRFNPNLSFLIGP